MNMSGLTEWFPGRYILIDWPHLSNNKPWNSQIGQYTEDVYSKNSEAFKSTRRWQKPSPNHFQINKLRQYFSAKTAPITNAQDCFNYHNFAAVAVTQRVQALKQIKLTINLGARQASEYQQNEIMKNKSIRRAAIMGPNGT